MTYIFIICDNMHGNTSKNKIYIMHSNCQGEYTAQGGRTLMNENLET